MERLHIGDGGGDPRTLRVYECTRETTIAKLPQNIIKEGILKQRDREAQVRQLADATTHKWALSSIDATELAALVERYRKRGACGR